MLIKNKTCFDCVRFTTSNHVIDSIIFCSLFLTVFIIYNLQDQFEEMFKKFEADVTFQYFKSFRRARINFESPLSAAKARIECHQTRLGDYIINCYFAQVI